MFKPRGPVLSRYLPAIAFAGALLGFVLSIASAATPAAAARVTYQERAILTCTDDVTCQGDFPALAANARLELEQVICHLTATGSSSVYEASVYYAIPQSNFVYFLTLASKTYTGVSSAYVYIFEQDGLFLVPAGKQLKAFIRSNAGFPRNAVCTLHGYKITAAN